MVKNIKLSHWKPVHFDAGVICNGIEGLVGIEELTQYELKTTGYRRGRLIQTTRGFDEDKVNIPKKKIKLKDAGSPKKRKNVEVAEETGTASEELKVRKRRKKKVKAGVQRISAKEVTEETGMAGEELRVRKRRKKKVKVGVQRVSAEEVGPAVSPDLEANKKLGLPRGMEAWNGLNVPYPVLRALSEQGFTSPTKIQALCLPPALFGRRDILGAAETGSGKTLAFGIPIIYGILIQKEKERRSAVPTQDEADEGTCDETGSVGKAEGVSDAELSEEDAESLVEGGAMGCVRVVNNVNLEHFGPVVRQMPAQKKLYALVLTPTRELAIQVKNHLVVAAKYTDIKVAVVVGGMAPQKQERVLSKGPEIVVATPGRLWELIQEGNRHLMQVNDIRYLAIDETDRMVEKGHFQELQQLLEQLNTNAEKKKCRQNFVFSATLTMVHEPPRHVVRKKTGKTPTRITPGQKLNSLITMLGITNPKVVDVTNETGTAELLSEACIHCNLEEKDFYLYYLLQKHAGRTLIFCNSISCVRRLAHLLGLLGCHPLPLHANMIQRQRLRNLDRFRANPNSLLLATDVAARGLDIPGVEHVIHYQVPRTSESYVHRSGRTARAQHAGITILLIEPSEVPHYARFCRTLGRDQQLPMFPVVDSYMSAVKQRVLLAREVDRLELSSRRTSSEAGWLQKAAREMDILLDDDDAPSKLEEDDMSEAVARHKRQVSFKRQQLAALLERPIFPRGFLSSYPALADRQQLTTGENALEALSASLGEAKCKKKKERPALLGPASRPAHSKKRRRKPAGQKSGAEG